MAVTKKDLWRMLRNTESGLMAHVLDNILEKCSTDEEVENYLNNVYRYGGQSGSIPSLVDHKDCKEFVKSHLDEILDIYNQTIEFFDPKEEVTVEFLAWLGYRSMVNIILSGDPVEDFNM